MSELRFEWDPRKSRSNLRKHRVSFEEASTVFEDERALLIHDPDHSGKQDRFLLLGLSIRIRVLLVVHVHRAADDVIRIVSARRASASERRQYAARWDR